MASYVQRINSIKDAMQSTVDNLMDKETPSDADAEKQDTYEQVITLLEEAVDLLEAMS